MVNDGLVLASDSATTLRLSNGDAQVYNNADKIFNLYKGLPIGAATWGLGAICGASMATLAKDFRKLIAQAATPAGPIGIDVLAYTVEEVATKFADFLREKIDEFVAELDAFYKIQSEEYEAQPAVDPDSRLMVAFPCFLCCKTQG